MPIVAVILIACSSDPSLRSAPPLSAERVIHDHYRLWYRDSDADGHGDPTVTRRGLVRPDGYVANATDCDDGNADIFRSEDCAISVAEADLTIGIDEEDARLGERTASADLDADGVADLAMGAYGSGTGGTVYLLYGPASGSLMATDLVSLSATSTYAHLGSAVGAGDANGDALDDLLVAADGDSEFYLFLGPVTADRTTSDADAEFVAPIDLLGGECADITHDLDGDGGPDLVMTAPYYSSSASWNGTVYVAGGTASGTLDLSSDATYTFTGPSYGELGRAAAEMGDTNGDGIAELALAAPYAYPPRVYIVRGAVFGYLGPLSGMIYPPDASVRWEPRNTILLGAAVSADDFDGDGAQDVAMSEEDGGVFVQPGYATGVVDVATLVQFSGAAYLGREAITPVPDWTGDGGSELALGARGVDGASTEDAGAVYVFFSESLQ